LFRLWQAHPVLMEERLVFEVCRWLGIAAAALGGLAALGQRRWGSLVGYASLVDWGAGLIALGQGTTEGAALATLMLVWRTFGLLLVGTGWGALYKVAGQRDDTAHCTGMLRRRPLSLLVLLIGLFSLAGLPLTPGAMGRQAIYGWLIAQVEPRPAIEAAAIQGFLPFTWPASAITLFLAGVGVCVGALAAVRTCLGVPQGEYLPREAPEKSAPQRNGEFQNGEGPKREDPPEDGRSRARRRGREGNLDAVVSAGFALLALWLIGALLLHHEPWLNVARQLLGGLTLPPS
jgi:NADH:ubiquinone oxidoreductase subunit 5 (subunit L)/multisubunit Na+/H+ antiporter MnhA subunit